MIEQKIFADNLLKLGVEFITGVPDTLLNDFCLFVESNWDKEKHVIAANEGNAVALATGYYLTSDTVPLVYMQNSGLGNSVNPLLSLTHNNVYGIPMILLIGWRGEPGKKDHPQHKQQGELTPILLQDMNIPYMILTDNIHESIEALKWAVDETRRIDSPVALLAGKGILEKGEKDIVSDNTSGKLSREEAMKCVLEYLPNDTVYVASTGRATRELYALRELSGAPHNNDFLNVGAMGHTSSIALGIAMAKKNKTVVCFDGDSAAIMHLGALTTSGKVKASNFVHIVLNNGVHESVGGQESAGYLISFTTIAEASGYKTIKNPVITKEEIQHALKSLTSHAGPSFIDIHIRKGIRNDLPTLKFDQKQSKTILMANLNTVK